MSSENEDVWAAMAGLCGNVDAKQLCTGPEPALTKPEEMKRSASTASKRSASSKASKTSRASRRSARAALETEPEEVPTLDADETEATQKTDPSMEEDPLGTDVTMERTTSNMSRLSAKSGSSTKSSKSNRSNRSNKSSQTEAESAKEEAAIVAPPSTLDKEVPTDTASVSSKTSQKSATASSVASKRSTASASSKESAAASLAGSAAAPSLSAAVMESVQKTAIAENEDPEARDEKETVATSPSDDGSNEIAAVGETAVLATEADEQQSSGAVTPETKGCFKRRGFAMGMFLGVLAVAGLAIGLGIAFSDDESTSASSSVTPCPDRRGLRRSRNLKDDGCKEKPKESMADRQNDETPADGDINTSADADLPMLSEEKGVDATTEAEEWGKGLPWSDLTSKLSPSASLIDTSPVDYLNECSADYEKPADERDFHSMIEKPSGLCVNAFFCGFEKCFPNPDPTSKLSDRFSQSLSVFGPNSRVNPKINGWVDDISNPRYNLPSKVLFPVVASDVVAAVQFARDHGLELSVKNSGHSYAGSSTKKNTLHINMNRYTPYAPTGLSDCDASTVDQETLTGQPCRLSLAKGKPAVIRVGGGENWDKIYRAVQQANKEQTDGYKYHAVGAGSGTVSPMGWTFQGGLSGSSGSRMFGFGVDQVLQVEMVLPNGEHVKFGPTKWEVVQGYDVPKTTSVSGVCRANKLEMDEDKWEWADCSDNINFDDLWFAVRGGGGGTWGVVLSLHLQLHDYLPLERTRIKPYPSSVYGNLDKTHRKTLDKAYQKFEILFLLDPESVNVTEDESNACGVMAPEIEFSCLGEGSAQVLDGAWRQYLSSISQNLVETGIPVSAIESAVNCTDCSDVEFHKDYASLRAFPEGHPRAGQVADDLFLVPSLSELGTFIIIPKAWILQNIDKAAEILPPNPSSYRAFGGRTSQATSDQANSLSQAHRDGGYLAFLSFTFPILEYPVYDDSLYTGLFPEMFDTSDDFPSFAGANHAGPNTKGPLKEDWTKACPMAFTEEERDEKCIPFQEAIYGTKLLKRLEAIKEAVDPNYMFDCFGCIGNNRVKGVDGSPLKEEVR